jgi:flavin-dependent dehydrogenase
LLFPRQGQIHPLAYLGGLAQRIVALGGRIHCGTHVVEVEDGRPTRVKTQEGQVVSAAATVVATNTPINNRFVIHTKQAAYRTFVVGLRVKKDSVPWAQWWDTLDPYHYVRIAGHLDDMHDLLIVGGEDHKTGQKDDAETRFERLAAWAHARFPALGQPLYRWSGQVMEPIDGLAFIGRNPGDDHVFIVTGDSGNGMTHGTIAGMLLTDLILDRENPWAKAYHPSRKSLKAAGEFAKENANVAARYKDWLTSGDVSKVGEIAAGGGAVIRHHLHKIAVYRDAHGAARAFDATSPHRLHRRVEQHREVVGLPLPRVPLRRRALFASLGNCYTSMFAARSAFCSMNSRRGSTSSPISMVKTRSASIASSICTRNRRRTAGSIVVSHSCSGFISPRPL